MEQAFCQRVYRQNVSRYHTNARSTVYLSLLARAWCDCWEFFPFQVVLEMTELYSEQFGPFQLEPARGALSATLQSQATSQNG
jgi:hypothetical protein